MTNESNKRDSFRKPEKLLAFAGLERHHRVLDLCTGFGYLARHAAMITDQPVDAQNASEWHAWFDAISISKMIQDMQGQDKVRHYYASMEDPAMSQRGVYDLITMQNGFHDLYFNMNVDRRKFFRSIRRALKPGGKFLLVDHQAGPGRGLNDAVEEWAVRKELKDNGFVVIKTSDMLLNSDDPYTTSSWTESLRETDRFVLLCEEAIHN
jgi:predicted methyltransferase